MASNQPTAAGATKPENMATTGMEVAQTSAEMIVNTFNLHNPSHSSLNCLSSSVLLSSSLPQISEFYKLLLKILRGAILRTCSESRKISIQALPYALLSKDSSKSIRYGPQTTVHILGFLNVIHNPHLHNLFGFASSIALNAAFLKQQYWGKWIAKYMGHKVSKTVHALYFRTLMEKAMAELRRHVIDQIKALEND
ncbi:hypothetical protein DL98DRAFT_655955 [Cadophora sp. DSE1049]|nr:hypothetical protein DL98DRAFT_655955 [Cadophora sp. DSE1049]